LQAAIGKLSLPAPYGKITLDQNRQGIITSYHQQPYLNNGKLTVKTVPAIPNVNQTSGGRSTARRRRQDGRSRPASSAACRGRARPQVVSLGALDMVNFGPVQPVPDRFADRNLYVHNPTVTLMRTAPAENAELGRRIAEKLNAAAAPTALFVPLSGVSAIDAEGHPFHDPVADDALFAAPRAGLDRMPSRCTRSLPTSTTAGSPRPWPIASTS
jgi:uncharacterized protein UPF0261